MSQLTGLPTAFVRKDAKPYGTAKIAEGYEHHRAHGGSVLVGQPLIASR